MMIQTYPLRLLQNAWQQTLEGNGQVLLFADSTGGRLGTLIEEFGADLDAFQFNCRLGPDAAGLGFYPLMEVLRALYDAALIEDCEQWLDEMGIYPPNRPTWRQVLNDHFFRRPSLQLKDFVIQRSQCLEDDLMRMLNRLTEQQPVLISLTNFHFASPSLLRLINRRRQLLPARLLILTASDPELLPGYNPELPVGLRVRSEELEITPWLVDLPPDLAAVELNWPESLMLDDQGIPYLIQLALENHALVCHRETLALSERISLALEERQIQLVPEHRYELLLVEAEANLYSDNFNSAITNLNELLEVARQERNDEHLFDAYIRLAWCALHKHQLDDAQQMGSHAKTALQNIEDKSAEWLLREREWLMLQTMLQSQRHDRLPAGYQHRLEALLPLNKDDDYLYAFRLAQVNWEACLTVREKHFLKKALLAGLRQARQLGHRVAAIKLLQGMAVLQANDRRDHRALTCLNLALKLCEPLRSPVHEVPVLNAIGYLYLQRGATGPARDILHRAMNYLQLTANYSETVVTLNNLAWTYFIGGNLPECHRLLSAVIQLCRIRGFRTLLYHTLDDLRLHQALCRFYLGNSVQAQRTMLEMTRKPPQLSKKGLFLQACLKLHFARSEADHPAIEVLRSELHDLLSDGSGLPAQAASMGAYAEGVPAALSEPAESRIPWMEAEAGDDELPALAIDVLSLLHSAELEGELERLQQRMRDTRLLSHLSAEVNAATDIDELIKTVCRQLSAHLDCDYVAIELGEQPFLGSIRISRGLPEAVALKLHEKLALQKMGRGRLLTKTRNLAIPGLDSGYVSVNRISLPHHDFGDLVLMTRSSEGFDESVLRTSTILTGQLAAAIQRLIHERELQHLSSTDMLTGLINRQALYPRLEEELARAKRHRGYRFCLAFLDLDNFKYLNDNYGHNLGDRVLNGFSRLLKQATRKEDVVARLGGDEFVILFPGEAAEKVQQLALRLLEHFTSLERCNAFLRKYTTKTLDISLDNCLGCSVGIVEIDAGRLPKSVDHLLNQADHAMYDAKRLGKNQAVISDCLQPAACHAKDE